MLLAGAAPGLLPAGEEGAGQSKAGAPCMGRCPPAHLGLLGGGHRGGAVGRALRGGVVAGHAAELDAGHAPLHIADLFECPATEEGWVAGEQETLGFRIKGRGQPAR